MPLNLPASLGSYQQLVEALLHDPFLGSGRSATPVTHRAEEPRKDDSRPAISYIETLAAMQELSKIVPNPAVARQFAASSEAAFAAFLDDYCGTPPHQGTWPWPGPPPWVFALAAEVVTVANTYASGAFREGLLSMAGRIAERGVAAPAMAGAVSAR